VSPPLFLIEDVPDASTLSLLGEEGRHAARVQRLEPGEMVLVSDGRGTVASCRVAAVRPDGLELAVEARRVVPEPVPRLVVVQALPKGDRGELAVEMLTELGVDEIVPWAAARSIAQWHGPRGDRALEKWRRTAREASKQSRRARLPEVAALASTEEVATRLRGAVGLVLHEEAAVPLADVEVAAGSGAEVVVIVGPEGGIAPDELERFAAAGATAIRLGTNVLRTSTAGPAALAALSLRLGRWGRADSAG
jgi:16S rRNA (uracil1498-N3)-methyltransferase